METKTQQQIDFSELQEIWKPIKDYENFYAVSNLGRVKRLESYTKHPSGAKKIVRERILKLSNSKGYRLMMVSVNGIRINFLVHRLVAQAFIPNPEKKPQVNHIDGNRNNNNFENLEWCTCSENEIHKAHKLGNIPSSINLKNVDSVNPIMNINGRNCVGVLIQKFYTDLKNGKKINTKDISYGRIYTLKFDLVNRFKVNIKKRRCQDGFYEYYM